MGWDQLRVQRLARMKELGIVDPEIELSPRHEKVPSWQSAAHKEWQQRRMEVYAAQVTVMDEGIGRIIDALRKSGRFENTATDLTHYGCGHWQADRPHIWSVRLQHRDVADSPREAKTNGEVGSSGHSRPGHGGRSTLRSVGPTRRIVPSPLGREHP